MCRLVLLNLVVRLASWYTRSNALPAHSQMLSQRTNRSTPYLHTNLLTTVWTLLLMLDNGLVITAIDVQSDNGIQCNTDAQKLEDLV